jgi:hypothetical protein
MTYLIKNPTKDQSIYKLRLPVVGRDFGVKTRELGGPNKKGLTRLD